MRHMPILEVLKHEKTCNSEWENLYLIFFFFWEHFLRTFVSRSRWVWHQIQEGCLAFIWDTDRASLHFLHLFPTPAHLQDCPSCTHHYSSSDVSPKFSSLFIMLQNHIAVVSRVIRGGGGSGCRMCKVLLKF